MNRNKLFQWGLILVVFWLLVLTFYNKQPKIGYVDSIKLVRSYKGMNSVQADIEKMKKEYLARIDTLRINLEQSIKEYELKRKGMAKSEQTLAEKALLGKQNQFYQYQQSINQKIKEEEVEITRKALIPVDEFIKQYGPKNNYDLIIGANNSGNIIYGNEKFDITDEIIEELNKD